MTRRSGATTGIGTAVRHSVRAAAIALALLFAGCGGGGGGSAPAAVNAVPQSAPVQTADASFTITGDSYGVQNATYLAATKSSLGLVLRAAIATSMTDPDFKTVARIDIANPDAVAAGVTYSLGGASAGAPAFPGTVYFFNGHASSLLKTTGGSITFTSYGSNPGDLVSGSYSAQVLDGNDSASPKGSYQISASFNFTTGAFGAILPAPVPIPPAAASLYSANCASCHSLGTIDAVQGSGPELALKGGKMNGLFPAGAAGHQGIALAASELSALRILLNAN